MSVILEANQLSMRYRVPVRETGIISSISALFRPSYQEVKAVKTVSFTLRKGEIVGFLGPNGEGKTTSLKLLSGILHPTAGTAHVLGFVPWERPRAYLKRMAMIRGSRPLSVPGELTVMDALRFQQRIYEVEEAAFRHQLSGLSDMLGLRNLINKPVRMLSLGDKMRAGLAYSLIYCPEVLFLDEPTIGLDVTAISMMRQFIADYNQHTRSTIVLTSHYMADVKSLCKRVILIDQGSISFDGELRALEEKLASYKIIRIPFEKLPKDAFESEGAEFLQSADDGAITLRVPKAQGGTVASRLMLEYGIDDFTIEDPPLELVIDRAYGRELLHEMGFEPLGSLYPALFYSMVCMAQLCSYVGYQSGITSVDRTRRLEDGISS